MITITLPETHPSINVWSKWHYHKYNIEKHRWSKMVWAIAHRMPKMEGRVNVEVKYYFKTNQRKDIDNFSPKFLMDGLVETGIIEDDNSEIVKTLAIRIFHDKKNPRTEIIITPYHAETY